VLIDHFGERDFVKVLDFGIARSLDEQRPQLTRPRGTFETPNLPGFYVIARAPAQSINSQILR
jgi:hypothetical protein